jgi:hypothetical protein
MSPNLPTPEHIQPLLEEVPYEEPNLGSNEPGSQFTNEIAVQPDKPSRRLPGRTMRTAFSLAASVGSLVGAAQPATAAVASHNTTAVETSVSGAEQDMSANQVPDVAQEFINKNVVYMNGLNCSGSLIRNPNGTAVGVLTASHCGLRNANTLGPDAAYFTPWIQSSNGSEYIFQNGGTTAETGSDMASMRTVDEVAQFILPPKGNKDIDQAIGVFPGHSVKEVLNSYQAKQLSADEINNLVPGESTLYMAGWPFAQNGDGKGNKIRQQFALTYIGQQTISNAAGETENVVLATAERDKDGAICSAGASGSDGFILQQVAQNGHNVEKVRSVGVLSVAVPLTGGGNSQQAAQAAQYYKKLYPNVNWNGVDALCGFSPNSLVKEHAVVNVATSLNEIPNPQVTTPLIAETLFFDPEYTPKAINGILEGVYEDDTKPGPILRKMTVENPVIFANKDGSIVVGYYKTNVGLAIKIFPSANDLTVYQSRNSVPQELNIARPLTFEDPTAADPSNLSCFQDGTGYQFGIYDVGGTHTSGQAYSLEVKQGHVVFNPENN